MKATELKEKLEEHGISVNATSYVKTGKGIREYNFFYFALVGRWKCIWSEEKGENMPVKLVRNGIAQRCDSYEYALKFMVFQKNLKRVTCFEGHSFRLRKTIGGYEGKCPKCGEYVRRKYDEAR
jgi:hypothetical protein